MTLSEILSKYDIGELTKNEVIGEIEKMLYAAYGEGFKVAESNLKQELKARS